ncbi:alpha/beta fold hydrolase [Lutimonas sp.]|uniref:alpha/beta fold hydrolase n=1 Tax=Lutimonas sp. TaxID=1872403 RepID=UPI003D9AEED4
MVQTMPVKIERFVFDCLVAGKEHDPLVLFLHGWPESSYMWKRLLLEFSEMGFYCVAPDLRGFSKNACPKGRKHYALNYLVQDVLDIADSFGKPKFHLVGHDWGAAIGWKLVHDYKDRIQSWTGISVPHLQAFGKAIVLDPEQQKMSQYIRNFQWPFLPERRLRKDDFKILRKLWKHADSEEFHYNLSIFKNPKQLSASINYYRGNYKDLKVAAERPVLGNIDVPTLFIWGNKDLAIGRYAVDESHVYMKNDYDFIELDAGHWLIQTEYDHLKKAITEHILKYKST